MISPGDQQRLYWGCGADQASGAIKSIHTIELTCSVKTLIKCLEARIQAIFQPDLKELDINKRLI